MKKGILYSSELEMKRSSKFQYSTLSTQTFLIAVADVLRC